MASGSLVNILQGNGGCEMAMKKFPMIRLDGLATTMAMATTKRAHPGLRE